MNVKFPSMEAYWDYIKAQSFQTTMVWSRLPEDAQEQIRAISPIFVANIEALTCGVEGEIESPVKPDLTEDQTLLK